MSVWRVYARVSLGGLAVLVFLMLLVVLGDDAPGTWGAFISIFSWVGVCLLLGLIVAFVAAMRRLAARLGSRPT